MSLFGKPTIARELRRRRITILLHSTHLYSNLPQILQDGELRSAGALREQYGPKPSARFLHDPNRYERFTIGLDYLNCSLTEPNFELLYKRSGSGWENEWVHLLLNLALLKQPDTLFSPVSAAQDRGAHVAGGVKGFTALFADWVERYDRKDLDPNQPTHPQAEALIKAPRLLAVVESIAVFNASIRDEAQRLCGQYGREIPVTVSPHLFIWPKRLIKKGDSF